MEWRRNSDPYRVLQSKQQMRDGSHPIPECGLEDATSGRPVHHGGKSKLNTMLKLGQLGMDTVGVSRSRPPTPSRLGTAGIITINAAAAKLELQMDRRRSSSSRRLVASSSATTSASSISSEPQQPTKKKKKERDLVFVAGATGRVGSRAVRELIKLGFRVRAAVRDAQRASSLVQSVAEQQELDAEKKKLEIVECDLEKQAEDGIVSAIGDAAVVVCAIGASEKEVFDVTGPYRIDYMATNKLVRAATAAKVEHFILVTSLGTNKVGFPAFLLNLFWGVLYWKRRAEEALIASGIPYTIVRPGGMERPTDAFKETHNLVVAAEDTYVGGQVSNLQVAELIAFMAKNRKDAYCKVVEVVAETTAPVLPMDQLLSAVPSSREPPPDDDDDDDGKVVVDSTVKSQADLTTGLTTKTERPLSPYTAYEELKPPTSPTPKV